MSHRAASQNSGPRVAMCSGSPDSTSCCSSSTALLLRLQLGQQHHGHHVYLSGPAKKKEGLSQSRMVHLGSAWPIRLTCSMPGPGPGLGSSYGPIPSLASIRPRMGFRAEPQETHLTPGLLLHDAPYSGFWADAAGQAALLHQLLQVPQGNHPEFRTWCCHVLRQHR